MRRSIIIKIENVIKNDLRQNNRSGYNSQSEETPTHRAERLYYLLM